MGDEPPDSGTPEMHRHKAGWSSSLPGKLLYRTTEGTPPVIKVELPEGLPETVEVNGKTIPIPKTFWAMRVV
jgi:hypothetical protein